MFFFFLMRRRPPRSTRTDTLFPYTTLFRSEPWVITDGGYLHGELAPGHRNLFETPIASHNLMRAHGAAVQAYRSEGAHELGLVVNIEPKYPASDRPEVVAAAASAHAHRTQPRRGGKGCVWYV